MQEMYRVETENSYDLIPLCALVWFKAEFIAQSTCKEINSFFDFESIILLSTDSTREWRFRVAERMTLIVFVPHKLLNGDGTGRVEGQLGHP